MNKLLCKIFSHRFRNAHLIGLEEFYDRGFLVTRGTRKYIGEQCTRCKIIKDKE